VGGCGWKGGNAGCLRGWVGGGVWLGGIVCQRMGVGKGQGGNVGCGWHLEMLCSRACRFKTGSIRMQRPRSQGCDPGQVAVKVLRPGAGHAGSESGPRSVDSSVSGLLWPLCDVACSASCIRFCSLHPEFNSLDGRGHRASKGRGTNARRESMPFCSLSVLHFGGTVWWATWASALP
jgi:hypothetical protein